jgi:hypothetical protein
MDIKLLTQFKTIIKPFLVIIKPYIIYGLILTLLLSVGIFGFYKYKTREGKTTQYGGLLEFVSVDKMFTSFAYVPLLDYQKDYLKRDMIVIASLRPEKVIKGLCFRQYEVGIGYDNIAEYFIKYQDLVCNGEYQKLPKPTILSTNPISSVTYGDYNRKKCDTWDLDISGKRDSRKYIIDQLKDDGKWDRVVENSQKILYSFIRINCE